MRASVRAWFAVAACGLPLLVLLLIPQLMRSRAGSETLLTVGSTIYLVLLVGLVVIAPIAAALTAPDPPGWTPRTALGRSREVWVRHRRTAWSALGLFLVVYMIGQAVGYGLAEVVPYVTANDPAPGWTLHYGPYLAQALIIYLLTTLAATCYALMLRRAPVGTSATAHP